MEEVDSIDSVLHLLEEVQNEVLAPSQRDKLRAASAALRRMKMKKTCQDPHHTHQ